MIVDPPLKPALPVLHRRMLHGGAALTLGQLLAQGASFIRNIIVARLVSPDNFGIAATLWITIALLDMLSNMNVELLLTQADDGDAPAFQRTAQLILAGRGLVCAAVIFALAYPISHLFGAPQAQWAFQLLAVYPLMRGFVHLDVNRFQRQMEFWPYIIVDVASQFVVVIVAYPLARWLHNYSALLWLLLAQGAIYVIGTHLVAQRHYGWTISKVYSRRFFHFGWPLLISSILLFCVSQGDQFLIGSSHRLFSHAFYTPKDLGIYSAALTLTLAPTVFLGKVNAALFLPMLARTKDTALFETRYRLSLQSLSLISALIAILWMILGRHLIVTLYGPQYLGVSYVIGWLAALQAINLTRTAPRSATLAKGDPHNSLLANSCRATCLIAALFAAATAKPLSWIAACGFFGEVAAMVSSIAYMRLKHSVPLQLSITPVALLGCSILAAALLVHSGVAAAGWPSASIVTCLLMMFVFGAWMLAYPQLRHLLFSSVAYIRRPMLIAPWRALALSRTVPTQQDL